MIKLYDEAIVAKINKWVKDPNLKVISPNDVNRLFQIKVDEANDKPLTLPMIAISRDPNVEILVNHRRSLSADGLKLDSNEKTSVQLDAIPINIASTSSNVNVPSIPKIVEEEGRVDHVNCVS